jgi:hypothetical protein
MNFDDILGKLMPLFEQKMAFSMEMSKRAMSLEEKKEASKTDLEYRKLEAQITNDKDKLTWEKEKLTTAIRGDYDLQTLKNNGSLDVKRLEGLNERDKQKIVEEGLNRRADQTNRTEQEKGYLTTLGTILGHAVEKTGTDAEGKPYSTKPTADVGTAAGALMQRTGLVPTAPKPASTFKGNPRDTAKVISDYYKAGDVAGAKAYVSGLDPAHRAEALGFLTIEDQTKAARAPAPAAAPAPVPAAPVAASPAPADEGEGYAAPVDPFGLMHRPNLNAAPINAAADPSGIITQRMVTRPSIMAPVAQTQAPAAPILAAPSAPTRPKSMSAMPGTFSTPATSPVRQPVAPAETPAQRKKRLDEETRLNQASYGG